MVKDINKNANGDINKNAIGDINRKAIGDINKNAEGDALGRPEPLGIDIATDMKVGKPPISVPSEVKDELENTVEEVATIVEVEGTTLKDKLINKTNTMGVTQDGKLTKSFGWGFAIAIGGFFLFGYLKNKGYLKKLPFYKN